MAYHNDRIGVYQHDGSVAMEHDPAYPDDPSKMKSKYPEIKYPENHKWNKGEGSSAYEIEKNWNKVVSTLPRKPQAGKRRSGKHIGEILLTHYFEFNISAGEDHWKRLRKEFPNDVEYYEKCEEYFNDARDVL